MSPRHLAAAPHYHFAVSIALVERLSDAELAPLLAYVPGASTAREVRSAAAQARAEGRQWVPPCRHASPLGLCLGHPQGLDEADTWGT